MITISSEIISNLNGKEKILETTYGEREKKKVIERSWISSAIQKQNSSKLLRGEKLLCRYLRKKKISSNYCTFLYCLIWKGGCPSKSGLTFDLWKAVNHLKSKKVKTLQLQQHETGCPKPRFGLNTKRNGISVRRGAARCSAALRNEPEHVEEIYVRSIISEMNLLGWISGELWDEMKQCW